MTDETWSPSLRKRGTKRCRACANKNTKDWRARGGSKTPRKYPAGGHVYVIADTRDPTGVKIGRTMNLDERLDAAQTWSRGRTMYYVAFLAATDPSTAEYELHQLLSAYRDPAPSEWFNITPELAKIIFDGFALSKR